MKLEITAERLLAGTDARRRLFPQEKAKRMAWLHRAKRANATTDEPDIPFLLEVYEDVILNAVRAAPDSHELLTRLTTPIGREELMFWFDQCRSPAARGKLFTMFNDKAVILYCQFDDRRILAYETWCPIPVFRIYPPETSTDFLADDTREEVDPNRDSDLASDFNILSAVLAEWTMGRQKSAAAREFVCSACEKIEQTVV